MRGHQTACSADRNADDPQHAGQKQTKSEVGVFVATIDAEEKKNAKYLAGESAEHQTDKTSEHFRTHGRMIRQRSLSDLFAE